MKTIKQILLLCLFGMIGIEASAQKFKVKISNGSAINYEVLSANTVKVIKSKCTGDITIPEKVVNKKNEYTVVSIDDEAFRKNKEMSSITIPPSITSIGEAAFDRCEGLKMVYISDLSAWCNITFKSEKSNPIYYAEMLSLNGSNVTNFVVPDGITTIKPFVFEYLASLRTITIPETVASVENRAFGHCSGLLRVDIKNTDTKVDDTAFEGCHHVQGMPVPSNEIWYEAQAKLTGNEPYEPYSNSHRSTNIKSHTFSSGKGVITYTIPLPKIRQGLTFV